ncbi:MAG: hypothetical protein OQK65_05415, partial [Chlorobium sp.]|nr:hypothetical protein [Chlorobium sp.]
ISVVAAIAGIYYAWYAYLKKPAVADKTASRFKGAYNILLNKYFLDEAYEASVVNPIVKGSENILWKIADNRIIDGTINNLAKLVDNISGTIKKIQTGVAQSYALVMILGVLIALLWLIISYS